MNRFLVIRDCFVHTDPIECAKVGDILELKLNCMQYFLFCDVEPNYWIDTAPISVATLGTWTPKTCCSEWDLDPVVIQLIVQVLYLEHAFWV